jgi:hypothetical protein
VLAADAGIVLVFVHVPGLDGSWRPEMRAFDVAGLLLQLAGLVCAAGRTGASGTRSTRRCWQ